MTRKVCSSLVAVALTVACTRATPEQQIVNDAAAALGGAERVVGRQDAGARRHRHAVQPRAGPGARRVGSDLHGQRASNAPWTWPGGRARTELTRTPNFTFFQGPAPQKQVAGIDGAVGYNVAPNGTATRAAEPVAADRRAELLHHPVTAVRAALDPMAKLSNPRTEGGQSMVDVATRRRPVVHAGDRRHHQAAEQGDHARLQREPGRRGHRHGLRRLPGGGRAAAAREADDRDRRLHHAGDHARRSRRSMPRPATWPRPRPPPQRAHGAAARADGDGRAVGQGHLVAGRRLAPQRAGGVRRSPDAHRGAAERGARAGGDCQGARAGAGQAAHAGREQPPPLRSLRRRARGDLRGADRHHAPGQRGVLPGDGQARPHASARRAVEVRQAGDGAGRRWPAVAVGSDDDRQPDRRVGPALAVDAGGALPEGEAAGGSGRLHAWRRRPDVSPAGSSRS